MNNNLYCKNVHGYLSADMMCFEKRTVLTRAKFKENCKLRGTNNAQGQTFMRIFVPNKGYCIYYPSNIFAEMLRVKNRNCIEA